MCGLVGVISKNNSGFFKDQCDMFSELLFVDTLRGDDATGVFMVDRDGDLEMIKEATYAPYFMRSQEFGTIMRNSFSRGKVMIGHNRKATKGEVNDENAHPFVVDDKIVLVHNGTLYNDYKKIPGAENVEVDSHAIAHLIHRNQDNVEAAIQELQGAYALIWYDMEKQSLNFLRNAQRPLHWMETHNSFVWASEKNMLEWMIARHNIHNGKVSELPAGVLHTMTFHGSRIDIENKKIELTKPYTASTTTSSTPNYSTDYSEWEGQVNDTCGYDPRACGYGSITDDTDDDAFVAPSKTDVDALKEVLREMDARRDTPFEEASKTIVRSASNKPRISAKVTADHRKMEEEAAVQAGAAITAVKFSLTASDFKEGSRYRTEAFDYQYVNGKDKENGFFLYSWVAHSDSFMARTYLEPEFPELQLVDWTTNKKDVSVQISSKTWRSFENKENKSSRGDGFVLFFCQDPLTVKFPAPTETA